MKPVVHILATCRRPELLSAATLVFQTLRVGFPTAQVQVWGNGLEGEGLKWVAEMARGVKGEFGNLPRTSHDCWIESLLQRSFEGFWVCDTDVVFRDAMELRTAELMAGRFEPEFLEEWTGTRHMARLHTCVMWLNAPTLRSAMRAWICRVPEPWRNTAEFPFVRQHFVPLRRDMNGGRETLFYDTCAGLWHSVGGRAFTAEENDGFEHLHCATYVDRMAQGGLPLGKGLQEFHRAVYANPKAAVGARVQQDKYYGERRPREPMTVSERQRQTKREKGKA